MAGWPGIAANVLPSISVPHSAESLPERQSANPEEREEGFTLRPRIRRIRDSRGWEDKGGTDHRAGAEWPKAQADLTSKCRLGGARDENERPFTVQPGWHPALLEILGSKPLLLLCWGNQRSARRFSLPELSDARFAKNPERAWTQDL
jgi:hypothetical protein